MSDLKMSDLKTLFGNFTRPHPWAQVRRRNAMAKLKHILVMTVIGLMSLAALALAVVFAGILAVAIVIGVGLMALTAFVTRKPIRVTVNRDKPQAKRQDGVLEARKNGSTWEVY